MFRKNNFMKTNIWKKNINNVRIITFTCHIHRHIRKSIRVRILCFDCLLTRVLYTYKIKSRNPRVYPNSKKNTTTSKTWAKGQREKRVQGKYKSSSFEIMETCTRDFLKKGSNEGFKFNLVGWNETCKPLSRGTLRLKILESSTRLCCERGYVSLQCMTSCGRDFYTLYSGLQEVGGEWEMEKALMDYFNEVGWPPDSLLNSMCGVVIPHLKFFSSLDFFFGGLWGVGGDSFV